MIGRTVVGQRKRKGKAEDGRVKMEIGAKEPHCFVFEGCSTRRSGRLLQRAVAGFPAGGAHP